jgi:nucleoid-associated protein YgaU
MSQPIQGKQYIAREGDTLRSIATRAYGLGENWTLIREANQFALKTIDQESVSEGEILFIPVDPDIQDLKNLQEAL